MGYSEKTLAVYVLDPNNSCTSCCYKIGSNLTSFESRVQNASRDFIDSGSIIRLVQHKTHGVSYGEEMLNHVMLKLLPSIEKDKTALDIDEERSSKRLKTGD